MTQFDALLRRALMDANLAQYEQALQSAETREPDFSPAYLRERMRLLADPWGWARRRPGGRRRLSWRVIAIIAALLLLSACAYAVATGQFSQWFPKLGVNPKAPEVSEEVLNRTGTVIEQRQTVDGATVTLNAAVWDGEYVRLSLVVGSPDFPEQLTRDSHIYTEECSLELPEDQRRDYLHKELAEWFDPATEDLEEKVQRYMEMMPSHFSIGFSQPSREGNVLTWEASMMLKAYVEHPELTLHIENIAIYEDSDEPVTWQDGVRSGPKPEIPVLKGPFDFTFTLDEPILPIRCEGEVDVTYEEIPFRFTGFEIGVFDMNLDYEVLAPVNPVHVTRPGEPEPEPDPDKLDSMSVRKTLRGTIQGLWTRDGKYVDCSQQGGNMTMSTSRDGTKTSGSVGSLYPHPIDPATVAALDLAGTRVDLSELEQLTG